MSILSINDNMQNVNIEKNNSSVSSPLVYTQSFPPLSKVAKSEREKRYKLQDKIQKFLLHHTSADAFKSLKKCLRVPHSSQVQIYKSKTTGKAFYGGLCTCSNLWGCPVCSSKVLARRGVNEVSRALYQHYHESNENNVLMVTFTHPHRFGMPLKTLITQHNQAMDRLKGVRAYINLMNELSCVYTIRSNEVTFGENGWHWHTHQLYFIKGKNVNVESLRMKIAELWLLRCKAVGMYIPDEQDFLRYSVDVMSNCHASDYLTKVGRGYWGADRELVGGANKKGHGKTPFQLIESDDEKENQLFLEYLYATKGKRLLSWSRGAKEHFNIEEKTDEQINEEKMDNAELVINLQTFVWQKILDNKARAVVLNIIENVGLDGLLSWFIENNIEYQDIRNG